jgi:hypothetical protein
VPYSGAISNVDFGEFGLDTGFVTLDTTPTNIPTEQGTIFWDADDETVDIVLNGYTMKIGEDLFYPVKNQTGSTIAKGVAVRFNGTVGNSGRLLIAPFIANGSVPSSRFMGVTAEEILNGEDGKVLYFGRVRGINTNSFNEGDILYASTTSAGGYQTAIPVAPNNIVQVAAVVTKSATVGTIFVRPTLGSNINKDEGVKITSVADKNLLQYQSGTSLWENKSLAQILGGTSSQFVKGDGSLDSNTYGTGTVTSVGLSSATSGVTIGSTPITTSGTITLAIATASGSQNGLLSSTDWTTFNGKQNALTNPVTGTGTSGQVAYFTGTSAISSESNLFWDATNDRLGIGTAIPTARLHLNGFSGAVNQAKGIKLTNTAGTIVALEVGDSNDSYVGTLSGSKFSIRCNNNPAITVDTALNVGIGTSSPSRKFVVSNLNAEGLEISTGTGLTTIISYNRSTSAFIPLVLQEGTGPVIIGTTSNNGERLQVNGKATALALDIISSSGVGSSTASGLARFITAGTTPGISVGQSNSARRLDIGSQSISVNGSQLNITTLSNHLIDFSTNLIERVRITSDSAAFLRMLSGTGGIQFNGDTAEANALDDYEEGTWTPTITGGYTGITYAFQNGWYRKIGSAVIVSGRVNFSGTANAGGISMACPFTQGPTGYGSGGIPFSDIAVITNTHPYITGGSSSVLFYTTGTGAQIGSSANVADKWLSFVITMSV